MPPASSFLSIDEAVQRLQEGLIVALPTETVYGLAGDIFQEKAVRSIFSVKGRPLVDPLIVHCADWTRARELALDPPEDLASLAAAFWPGPLTIVLPKVPAVSDLVTAGLPGVALRVPAHPVFRQVLDKSGLNLAAPSANPFGYISPTRAEHVRSSFPDNLGIVDGGPCDHGVESTILSLMDPLHPRILRLGPIPAESIEQVLKRPLGQTSLSGKAGRIEAPGQMSKHYSPSKPVRLFERLPDSLPESSIARIHLARPKPLPTGDNLFWLSEDGSLPTVAHNLFHLLRSLDSGPWLQIEVELPAEEGLGLTIRDRLYRAAGNAGSCP